MPFWTQPSTVLNRPNRHFKWRQEASKRAHGFTRTAGRRSCSSAYAHAGPVQTAHQPGGNQLRETLDRSLVLRLASPPQVVPDLARQRAQQHRQLEAKVGRTRIHFSEDRNGVLGVNHKRSVGRKEWLEDQYRLLRRAGANRYIQRRIHRC